MNWPENYIARALEYTYRLGGIDSVSVEAIWFDPLRTITTVQETKLGELSAEQVLPDGTTLDDVDSWVQELAWMTGAVDLVRWAAPTRAVEIGAPYYRWRWIPAYQRRTSPFFRKWLSADPTLNEDGGRSQSYPGCHPMSIVAAAQIFPVFGTSKERVTVFEFR